MILLKIIVNLEKHIDLKKNNVYIFENYRCRYKL